MWGQGTEGREQFKGVTPFLKREEGEGHRNSVLSRGQAVFLGTLTQRNKPNRKTEFGTFPPTGDDGLQPGLSVHVVPTVWDIASPSHRAATAGLN